MKSKKYIVINWVTNDVKWGNEKQFQSWKNKIDKDILKIINSEYDKDEGVTRENVGIGYTKKKVGCGFEIYNEDDEESGDGMVELKIKGKDLY